MKNLLDEGFLEKNPDHIKDTMGHVVARRWDHVKNHNGRKPIKIVPKVVDQNKITKRLERTKNVI